MVGLEKHEVKLAKMFLNYLNAINGYAKDFGSNFNAL